MRSHAHASAHAENIRDVLKKALLVSLKTFQGVQQIARLKQRFLFFTFYKTQRSYEKIVFICYFTGSVVKIVLYLHFLYTKDDGLRQIKKRHEFFFSIRVFFTDTDDSQGSREREGTIFYSTLPLPPAREYWDIYLQLCMWDDYHVFLIATFVFTRLLLNEIYHLVYLMNWY